MPKPHPRHMIESLLLMFVYAPGLQEHDELPVVVVEDKYGHDWHSLNTLRSYNILRFPV
jgi:hypothetical protein